MDTHLFHMPDYYPDFSCKMGVCRNACCNGWPVAFSLEEYFKLNGEAVSPALREKLDRGLKVSLHPTPDRYAEILPRYDGSCPVRLADGRCALQAELGEQALSDVCRLYPRGIREEEDGYEISCANSCEAVPELFLGRAEPLRFVTATLAVKLPPLEKQPLFFGTFGHERAIRLSLIATMQDRTRTLPERLAALKARLATLSEALRRGSETAVTEWLGAKAPARHALPEVGPLQLEKGLAAAEKLISLIDERSDSVRAYGSEALARFGSGGDAFLRYEAAKRAFETAFPGWAVFFEHLIVNHMFFSRFPFEDRPEDLAAEAPALCVVYMLLRFLAVGCSGTRRCSADTVDLVSAAFRLIDHTEFDLYVSHLLEDLGDTDDETILEWIVL